MSVLLEALKRAALEKKDRQDPPDAAGESKASEESPVRAEPEPPAQDVAAADPELPAEMILSEDQWDGDEFEIEEFSADLDEDDSNQGLIDPELLDDGRVEDDEPEVSAESPEEASEEALDESSVSLEEILMEVESIDTATTDDLSAEEPEDAEEREAHLERQVALVQAEERREQERLDRERRQQEETLRLEQERLREEARLAEEQARHAQLDRQQQEEAEAKQQAEQEEAEATAAREEARDRAERESAITQLIHEGHAINQRQKRRSRFLYAVLVLTAIGGTVAYYFYLLGSNMNQMALDQPSAEAMEPSAIVQAITESNQAAEVVAPTDGDAATIADPISTTSQPVEQKSGEEPLMRNDSPPSAASLAAAFAASTAVPPPEEASAAPERIDNARLAAEQSEPQDEVVHIYREAVPTELSQIVTRAYAAYQAGNYPQARRLYDEALQVDAKNRDALLGAAAVATAQGNYQQAVRMYQIRLADNPADTFARSGLLALSTESLLDVAEINRLIESAPEDAHFHFLKGAYHAARSEWSDAQAAFFDAHHWNKTNPDYAYNLAVSLDHLGQNRAAARFYDQALTLARDGKASFSTQQVQDRLRQLESMNE